MGIITDRLLRDRPALKRVAELAIEAIEQRRDQPRLAPATRDSVVRDAVAAAAADPVVVNETNSEPWYQSRVIVGLIVTIVGLVMRVLGIEVTAADEGVFAEGVTAVGTLMALVGRLLKNRGPMNWNPLTWFGLKR